MYNSEVLGQVIEYSWFFEKSRDKMFFVEKTPYRAPSAVCRAPILETSTGFVKEPYSFDDLKLPNGYFILIIHVTQNIEHD